MDGIIKSFKRSKIWLFVFTIGFFASGVIINILQLALLITVKPFSIKKYRILASYPSYFINAFPVFFLTWWSNSEIDFYFLPEDLKYLGKEHTALIVNHRYDMDWLCSLIFCDHFRTMRGIQAFIKDMLKFVPVVGWSWYFQDLIFLQRSFEKDQQTIQKALSNTFDDEQCRSLLLFAEGTRFNKAKHDASIKFAKEHNQEPYKHHLIPRTRGFKISLPVLKEQCGSVLNVQVAFDESINKASVKSILVGKPLKCHIYIKRIPIKDVPSDENEAGEFINDMYREKDRLHESFVKNGHFGTTEHIKVRYQNRPCVLFNYVFWLSLSLAPTFYYLLTLLWKGDLFYLTLMFIAMGIVGQWVLKGISATEVKNTSTYGTS